MSEINRTSSGAAPEGAAAPSQAPKQQPEHVKGPPLWLGMDQKEIDDAYDQSVWAPNREHVGKRRRLASERALGRIGAPERVDYGPNEIEKLDIYTRELGVGSIIVAMVQPSVIYAFDSIWWLHDNGEL